jgi:hypothetical protein
MAGQRGHECPDDRRWLVLGRDPDQLVDGYELVTVSETAPILDRTPTTVAHRAAEPMRRRTRFRACPSE